MSEEINSTLGFLFAKELVSQTLSNIDQHIYDQYLESIKGIYSVESSLFFMRDTAI